MEHLVERAGQAPFVSTTFPRAQHLPKGHFMASRRFSATLLSAVLSQPPLVEADLSRSKRATPSCPVSHKCENEMRLEMCGKGLQARQNQTTTFDR